MDFLRMAELFVEHIKKEYLNDIAIVAYYGSYAQGTQNPNSDFDLFFIPATKRGKELSDCIILDGIGIDFFPISWERAERIANFEENIVSVIADCKLLYSRSNEDKERLEFLQETIRSYQKPEKRKFILDKASQELNKVYLHLYKLSQSKDPSEQREQAFHALSGILQSIVFINQTYLKSGWGKNFKQIFSMKYQPDGLKELVYQVINNKTKNETLEALEKLCNRTSELLKTEKNKLRPKNSFKNVFEDFYEELRSTFLKIETACDNNQTETAFCAAAILQDEVKSCLHATGDPTVEERFSKIEPLREYDPSDLQRLKKATKRYEKELVKLLKSENVPITELNTLEQFQKYLLKKKTEDNK